MTLRDFCKKHTVGSRDTRKNKKCSRLKDNCVPMFHPKISPNKEGDDYYECCKHALMKHVPWMGLRNTAHDGCDDDKQNAINLWEGIVKSVMSSGSTPPDYLQTEMDTHVLNR